MWALPHLPALAPSERSYQVRGRKLKKITDWARQLVFQVRRWFPDKALVVVGDSSYAAPDFLHACASLKQPVTVITRLRLDAALYEPARPSAGRGRPRKKDQRLPTPKQLIQDPNTAWTRLSLPWYGQTQRPIDVFSATVVWFHYGLPAVPIRYVLIRDGLGKFDPQALSCTDCSLTPEQILTFFMRRWQMEPTFRHVRTHLSVETQRQGSDLAITRTTPALLGLFSVVSLLADTLIARRGCSISATAWYPKSLPTFSDALALVRRHLWAYFTIHISDDDTDMVNIPRLILDRFHDALCYAA